MNEKSNDQPADFFKRKDVLGNEQEEIKIQNENSENDSASISSVSPPAQKKPWLAALLSFLMPGLGHVYAGKIKKAVLLYFGFLFIAFSLRFIAFQFFIFAAIIIAVVTCYIFVMVDSFLIIKRNPGLIPGKHDRWYIYILNIFFQSMLLGMIPGTLNEFTPIMLHSMPTPSMSPTFEPGDCVAFSRTKSVNQNDVVVFKYPEDTSILYSKRCVGFPGDNLQIKNGNAYINDKMLDNTGKLKYQYIIQTNDAALNLSFLQRYDMTMSFDNTYLALLTEKQADEISKIKVIKNVEKRTDTGSDLTGILFPKSAGTGWTTDNYGPVFIPQKGKTVKLTKSNVYIYENIIRFENNDCSINESTVELKGEVINYYTFKEDYYFVLGDSRHNSLDSRYWGFLPANYMIGKALYIYWSNNKNRIGLKVE